MRFLKSPTCALHMLLPGASETRQSYASPFRNKRMCEQKASPLLRCRNGPVGDLWRGWWCTPRYFKDEWQPSALRLWFDTFFFFPAGISIWWMAENGLDFSLLWSYMYCMYCNASIPPSIHPKLVLLQSFEDNLNVSSSFVCFSSWHTDTHAHTVLIH